MLEQERERAEQTERQLEQERQRAEQERQQRQQKQQEAIAQLSSLGLSAEQIAGALGLSVQDVQQAIDN